MVSCRAMQSLKVLPWYWTFCTMALGCTNTRPRVGRFDATGRRVFVENSSFKIRLMRLIEFDEVDKVDRVFRAILGVPTFSRFHVIQNDSDAVKVYQWHPKSDGVV